MHKCIHAHLHTCIDVYIIWLILFYSLPPSFLDLFMHHAQAYSFKMKTQWPSICKDRYIDRAFTTHFVWVGVLKPAHSAVLILFYTSAAFFQCLDRCWYLWQPSAVFRKVQPLLLLGILLPPRGQINSEVRNRLTASYALRPWVGVLFGVGYSSTSEAKICAVYCCA